MTSHSSCRPSSNSFRASRFHLGPRNKQSICWYVVPGPSCTVSIPSCFIPRLCCSSFSVCSTRQLFRSFCAAFPFTRYIWIRVRFFTPSWLVDRSSTYYAIFMMWPSNLSGYNDHSFRHVILGPCAFGDQWEDRTMDGADILGRE